MNYKHKNINEQLRVLVMLGNGYSGESFTLTFSTGKGGSGIYRHVCKYDATTGVYTSCELYNGNAILCNIPPRKVGTGILVVQKQVVVEDWSMANHKQMLGETSEVTVLVNGREYGVEMTTSATDLFTPSAITAQLLPLFTRGRPGKTRWADLTDDEKRELAALLPAALHRRRHETDIQSSQQEIGYATHKRQGIVRVGEGLCVTTEGTLSIDWDYVIRRLSANIVADTEISTEI